MIGSVLGNYKVLDQISAGGMGSVYRAQHTLIGRIVAVKVLHPEMCANKDIVNRFFNEARATTAIQHPGIVEIFDFGYMPSGHAYLVMEFLEGMPLSQRMKLRRPIPEGEAAMVLRGACSALAAAHSKGIVHRDLKPDNIFVIPDPDSPLGERCKLLDFGIAKLTDIGMAGSATKTGAVMGTPTYMSPEQCKGTGAVDHRADLYSIGCILYELVVGHPPFRHLGAGELIGAHLYARPDAPSMFVSGISPDAESLIMTLLDKQPENRVQSAREVGAYLTQIAQRAGWAPGAEPDRLSMPMMSADQASMSNPSRPMFTPLFPSAVRNPVALTPLLTPPQISISNKPTTLSAATGQTQPHVEERPSQIATPRRRGLWIALGATTLAIVGGVAIIGATRHPGSPTAATQPTPVVAPVTPVTPVAPTPPPVRPPPAPVAPVAPPPPPTPAVVPAPLVPDPPAPVPTPAVVHKPTAKPAKPAIAKPATKPTEPQPKKTDPLLENDL